MNKEIIYLTKEQSEWLDKAVVAFSESSNKPRSRSDVLLKLFELGFNDFSRQYPFKKPSLRVVK